MFGGLIILAIGMVSFFGTGSFSSYDVLFICAVVIQLFLLISGMETREEFTAVFVFHILATLMELFKTHPSIGSWSYPGSEQALFAVAAVPLFVGFMYSAVGSYITRATKTLSLEYHSYPKTIYTVLVACAIYLNFFTHHYIYDFRYVLLVVIVILFWNTQVHFKVYKKQWSLPFIMTGLLTTFFVWVAENIATYYKIWLYPNQIDAWQMISFGKYGSWFLLLVVSFIIVKTLHLGNNAPND